jgi:exopolysaccharide biosynthesis polyprenyl glycosylphosphotransferase
MLSRKHELSLQVTQIVDGLLLAATLYICYALRAYEVVNLDIFPQSPPLSDYYWQFVVFPFFGPLLLEIQGFYQYSLEKNYQRSLQQILYAGVWLGLIIGACVIFLKLSIPSRSAFLMFLLAAPTVLLLREKVSAALYIRRLHQGIEGERVILAGNKAAVDEVLAGLTPQQKLEIHVVESINLDDVAVSDLVEAIHRHNIGRVILATGQDFCGKLQEAIAACETEGVEAWVAADFFRASIARPSYEQLGRTPMLVFRVTPELSWALLLKESMDRVGALIGLIMLSPLLLVVATVIKLTSPGPVIFSQQRAGKHGQPFTMYKFRSMRAGAEKEQEQLKVLNEMSGPVFKVPNDPRITTVGRWIRRTSIDEFPQLFNVLLGHMSLVGPRPLPLYEVDNFELTSHRRRLSMKPGLTCLWQIRGRNNVKNFHEWVKLDVEYIDNWSLSLDIAILLKTVPVVLFGTGAK